MHSILADKKVAIVSDWLTNFAGAERVVEAIADVFPHADFYTSIYNEEAMKVFSGKTVHTSFISKLPFARRNHQIYLPLMPCAFEAMNLDEYDIVISSCHACSKGIVTSPSTLHICYCHSPMRYLWDNATEYVANYGWYRWPFRFFIDMFLQKLRVWDLCASVRPDVYIANSHFVQKRIQKYYRRESTVIYPPVDTDKFVFDSPRENFYLAVGRLIPYKRFDLVVDAFNQLGHKLIIVGTGKEFETLKSRAKDNITFTGFIDDVKLSEYYATARALIFPQVEDFGITPLEAMASGCPVIAYGQGGACETVTPDVGIVFDEQSVTSIVQAVRHYEKRIESDRAFDPVLLSAHAKKFSKERFEKEFKQFVIDELTHRKS